MTITHLQETRERKPVAPDGEIPENPRHWRREHFIPIQAEQLADHLAQRPELDPSHRQTFQRICQQLQQCLHDQYHQQLLRFKQRYAPFDPDRDTCPLDTPDRTQRQADIVFRQMVQLLERANYQRLSREAIEQAVSVTSDWGLKLEVDFEIFQNLEVYARGDIVSLRARRRWHDFYRRRQSPVAIYQRLVIMFQLRDELQLNEHRAGKYIYLKTFKNIPQADIEMLLPGTHVKMTLLDQSRILVPTLSGIAISLFKIVNSALLVAFASFYGLLAFLGLVGGTIGYGVKSFFGYVRTRDKYRLNLTKNLYYQNLDNNGGVLYRLIDEVEEQEFRETALAYFLLWTQADGDGWTTEQLDRAAESLLTELIGVDVDFEIEDALRKLARYGLAHQTSEGRWQPIHIEQADAALHQARLQQQAETDRCTYSQGHNKDDQDR